MGDGWEIYPGELGIMLVPNQEPICYHTQHIERLWRELKRILIR